MEYQNRRLYASHVLRLLKRKYRNAMRTGLNHENPWELLVATVLSAQAQDRQVNLVTPALFTRYKSIEQFASANPSSLYRYTNSIGLYKTKSRNIVNAARMLRDEFKLQVPHSIEGLIKLPGVGRKTANVVLSNAYGINEGIAIDTHCITVANRLGLARSKKPEVIEKILMAQYPKKEWQNVSHLFIALGRDTCTARKKICERCILKRVCPSSTLKVGKGE
ncbi:endonuclease III [Candidatus Marsarchaeota archaeon]|nr:endonuclease III [Candidatus Marsarchaeota archaeon]MCL5092585.1 endonuclease III [Candidatus Marsarchaeota archaeon]